MKRCNFALILVATLGTVAEATHRTVGNSNKRKAPKLSALGRNLGEEKGKKGAPKLTKPKSKSKSKSKTKSRTKSGKKGENEKPRGGGDKPAPAKKKPSRSPIHSTGKAPTAGDARESDVGSGSGPDQASQEKESNGTPVEPSPPQSPPQSPSPPPPPPPPPVEEAPSPTPPAGPIEGNPTPPPVEEAPSPTPLAGPIEGDPTPPPVEEAPSPTPAAGPIEGVPTSPPVEEAPSPSPVTGPIEGVPTSQPFEGVPSRMPAAGPTEDPVSTDMPTGQAFDISNCDSYSLDWLADLLQTCSSQTFEDSDGCECTTAARLLSDGLITCETAVCPDSCEVCSFCIRQIGC